MFKQRTTGLDDLARGGVMVEALRLEGSLLDDRTGSIGHLQFRLDANTFDLSAEN